MEFFSKIVQTYCEKKLFYWFAAIRKICSQNPQICKMFEITRTIYLNFEMPERFLKLLFTGGFYNLQTGRMIETIKMPIGINNWQVETYRNKLEKLSEKALIKNIRFKKSKRPSIRMVIYHRKLFVLKRLQL